MRIGLRFKDYVRHRVAVPIFRLVHLSYDSTTSQGAEERLCVLFDIRLVA